MSNLPIEIIEMNKTFKDFARYKPIHEIFEEQARKTPDAIACIFESESKTYQEINLAANVLAARFESAGVKPNDLIGIFLNRSIQMLVGILGILKTGAAYVPLDPSNPKDRLALVINDSRPSFILTNSNLANDLPSLDSRLMLMNEINFSHIAEHKPVTLNTSSALAYVIYTSGSTGKPKGVEISHRALVNFILSMQEKPGINSKDVLLAVTTLSFDIAGLELFLPLSVGAKVIIASQDSVVDGRKLKEIMASHKVSIMQATPATWVLLLDAGWSGNKDLKILCGGEALQRMLANQLLKRCGELWNMYGPTETTIWSTLHRVGAGTDMISIGRPIANTQAYILDEKLQAVPVGETGELHIGGEGLAVGYHGRPDLTQEKFIKNPFGEGRIYKTGDVARCRSDGTLDCLGRLDHQVKIRGFRIELGEIEQAIAHSQAVKKVIVVAREDGLGGKRLAAYLVAHENKQIEISELRKLVSERLPSYMIPSAYVILKEMPLTQNGKVDRKLFPEPNWAEANQDAAQTYENPVGETEIKLSKIWHKVLNNKKVGRKDNFFSSGGNSITLARVSHGISEVFDIQIPVTVLYLKPTIAEMAVLIDQRKK